MKIVIGYDGSEHADAALADLARAGLGENTEARVMMVVEGVPDLPDVCFDAPPSQPADLPPAQQRAFESAKDAIEESRGVASRGAEQLRARFGQWKIDHAVCGGSPAPALVEQARRWQADLIVVGSHGRSALGRALLGSVSQSIVTHAGCSVRVVRPRTAEPTDPVRLILGLDGSPNSAAALNAVSLRDWPPGTEVRLVIARDVRLVTVMPSLAPDMNPAPMAGLEGGDWPKQAAQSAAAELGRVGLATTTVIRDGDPKTILLEEADTANADCIFLGARGLGRIEGFLLGSVSSAVSTRAHCTVEIVRFE